MGKIRTTFYIEQDLWLQYQKLCEELGYIPSRMFESFMLEAVVKARKQNGNI